MCPLDVVFNFFLIFPTRQLGSITVPGAGLGVTGAALGTALAEAVVALLAGRSDLLSSLLITVPSALAYLLVTLPLMMKLGVEKGRFILLLLTLAFLLAPELIQ